MRQPEDEKQPFQQTDTKRTTHDHSSSKSNAFIDKAARAGPLKDDKEFTLTHEVYCEAVVVVVAL